ncbi:unnamed protein product [Arabidopsis lyrata]|uniref:uncharacterized protein LOC110228645 n=1 Tax=Arabidopsis lyrata subsp. lyrata TaxID=81972 RepID=UPI000A29CDF6|nr:uncharacterized protein LOC110228645 [Arabidopsis lyrata subsp. lyrata]CAH8267327.1 unnamed protein product [Arabidopsis lyrata]|eukprot:XP_020882203.1 uncharacterized protein LOC110228645 [Arabidopsis lyrata subsp. lyrata]
MDKHCIIEFDGASKGNPGRAGSGAVLRDSDGTVIASYREGLGTATSNQAEYRGLNRGLEAAREKGYTHVKAYGDSELVVKQTRGEWQVRHPRMAEQWKQTNELKSQFKSFDITHVPREYNSEADSHANSGTYLQDGQVQEIPGKKSYY